MITGGSSGGLRATTARNHSEAGAPVAAGVLICYPPHYRGPGPGPHSSTGRILRTPLTTPEVVGAGAGR